MKTWGNGVTTEKVRGRVHVVSPYSSDFVRYAKSIQGRWEGTRGVKAWSFSPATDYWALTKALNRIYGIDIPEEALDE